MRTSITHLSHGVLALLLLTPGISGCKQSEGMAQLPTTAAAAGKRTVRTVTVRTDQLTAEIQATGTTGPLSLTKVMPLVTGLVTSIPVQEGDVIKRGQVVTQLDQRGYRLHVAQAEAAIEAARVAVDATAREKERFQRLIQEDALARSKFDQVMDRFRGAQAQMKQAQVARDMARKALADTTLRAPYDGVVVKKMASVGDYATAMPPTVILVLMDIHMLELKIALPESDLARVSEKDRVTARLSSLDRTVQAQVSRIIRSVDPLTRSFEVIVEIPNQDLSLKPGVFADVTIVTSKPRRRLLVPSPAVIDEGGGIFAVFLAEGGVARRREIKISVASQSESEILSGLTGGEQVILDASGILDGDPIEVRPRTPGGPLAAEKAR